MHTKYLCVLIHIWIKGEVGAWNRFKPSSKIFYSPFQGGTSFVDLLWVFLLSCVCYAFVRVCLYVPRGHLLGKGWSVGLWCLTVTLSLSHWYPGSGVVLDCIDSWCLHPYLLLVHLAWEFGFKNCVCFGQKQRMHIWTLALKIINTLFWVEPTLPSTC